MSGSPGVLIVARDFLPYYPSLGVVIRALKLADFLQTKGCRVHVLAARGHPVSTFGYDEVLGRLQITYLDDFLQRQVTASGAYGRTPSPWVRRLTLARQFLMRELLVPDLGTFLYRKFADEAEKIVRRQGLRNVIVTSPPHSTQLVGLALKKRLGDEIRLIVDYRDSWNLTGIFRHRNPLARALSERLERRVLGAADRFTCHSAPVLSKINRRYFDISDKAILVANGFDDEMSPFVGFPKPQNEVLTLGYFGALSDSANSIRNPGRFFEALEHLPSPIRLQLFGDLTIGPRWRTRLGDRLVLGGNLPHGDALQRMGAMDVLLVLHSEASGADEVIPAKTYEYMLAGRPILVVGPRGMQCARIVQGDGLGYVADLSDRDDMLRVLARLHADWKAGRLPHYSRAEISHHSRRRQYEKLLALLA